MGPGPRDHADEVRALRQRWAALLPADAWWSSSAEPKAVATARLLVDRSVMVEPDLGEHRRAAGWVDDMPATVRRAFARADECAAPGWEPLAACRSRVLAVVHRVLAAHPGRDVVLVGHGTAWTLVAADLTGEEPDLERWEALGLPDVITVPRRPTMSP